MRLEPAEPALLDDRLSQGNESARCVASRARDPSPPFAGHQPQAVAPAPRDGLESTTVALLEKRERIEAHGSDHGFQERTSRQVPRRDQEAVPRSPVETECGASRPGRMAVLVA